MKVLSRVIASLLCVALVVGFQVGGFTQNARPDTAVRIRVDDNTEVKLYDASFALIVGSSDYTGGWADLPGVARDVPIVKQALERQGFQVSVVMNPTRVAFDEAMRKFINDYGYDAGNRLLIYFAGHGYTQKDVIGERDLGYIVPVDAPRPGLNERRFRQIAISMDAVEAYARQIEAKHALFIFDSCFSGSLISRSRGGVPPIITSKTTQPVRQFITAGADSQEVPDVSIFREQFVEGLEGEADLNRDGYVTGSELATHLQDKVTNYTRESQTPQYGKIRDARLDRGDFVFVMPQGKNAATTAIPKLLPPVAAPEVRLNPESSGASVSTGAASIVGTMWFIKTSDGNTYVVEFLSGGKITLKSGFNDAAPVGGVWQQQNKIIRFKVNNYSTWEGIVTGDTMDGGASNPEKTWTWTAANAGGK